MELKTYGKDKKIVEEVKGSEYASSSSMENVEDEKIVAKCGNWRMTDSRRVVGCYSRQN